LLPKKNKRKRKSKTYKNKSKHKKIFRGGSHKKFFDFDLIDIDNMDNNMSKKWFEFKISNLKYELGIIRDEYEKNKKHYDRVVNRHKDEYKGKKWFDIVQNFDIPVGNDEVYELMMEYIKYHNIRFKYPNQPIEKLRANLIKSISTIYGFIN
tara:strand:+ start:998 stop:1453 length:456 start_codon:yes stop_codon:yes gene_type:complete